MVNSELISQAYENYLQVFGAELGITSQTVTALLTVVSLWSLVWKGLALYKSARRKQPIWFVILLITNTVGILPIIYLIIYKIKDNRKTGKNKKDKKSK